MRLRSRTYLVSMLALLAVTTALGPDFISIALGLVVGPSAIVIVVLRVREMRPSRPGIWYSICATGGVFLLAGVTDLIMAAESYPSLPDLFDLVGYSIAVATLAVLLNLRTSLGGRHSISESLIVPGSLAVIIWNYVIVTGLRNDMLSTEGQILNGTFNTLSLTLCGLVAALLFGPGRRDRAIYLLSAMGGAALVGDVTGSMETAGTQFPGITHLAVLAPALAFMCAGLAAIDPSMARVTEPTIEPVSPLGTYRLVTMCVAAMTAPLLLVSRIGQDDPAWATLGTLLIWVLTLAGILARLSGLIHAREKQAAADRVLAVASEQFMASTAPPAMYRSAIHAASVVAEWWGVHRRTSILSYEDGKFCVAASVGPEMGDPTGTVVRFLPIHDGIRRALESRSSETFFDLPALDSATSRSETVTIFPLVASGSLRGAFLINTDRPLRPLANTTLSSLAADLSLALEGAARAEAEHREASERRFRALVDESNDVIALLDDDANLDFIGPAVSRLLGHDENRLLGTPMIDLVAPEDQNRFRACIERHPSAPASTEVRLVDARGNERWFDIVAADHRHDPNIGGVVVTARDVHGRKVADDRTHRSEARFRSLVQHATDLVAVLQGDGTISYSSPSSSKILGIAANELVGTTFADLVTDRHRARLRDALVRLGTRPDVPYDFELDLVTAAGETRTLDITARDLRHDETVEGIVVNARDITDRKRLEDNLRHQALHDSLTGIPNRTLFSDRVEQALTRREADVAVFVIDIDDFKTVNDGLGHHAGDDLLKILAFRLRQVLRVGDTAARLGGDEFAVLIEDASDREKTVDISHRLLTKIREPVEISGSELTVEGSIGIAFSSDLAHRSAETLIRSADAAMYSAKASGKGRSESYEESMHLGAMERLHLKSDLSRALDLDEFRLWYQPVVNLTDGSLVGFEALIRWERTGHGLVSPADFIPLVEESGLIVPIGRWVLHEATERLAEWSLLLGRPDLQMGINVSPRQLQGDGILDDIQDALRSSKVEATNIAIELTETSRVDENGADADRLAAIGRLGCEVYADDFGAGYASYAALRRLPFSGVKLDRSLIDGVAHQGASSARAQVRSMIEMARHLDLDVIAEGIETPQQVEVLLELGCTVGQGFHFARPSADGGVTAKEATSAVP
jgi:diguanylate cyclase (GGDEF)-like protein/PAS domain S-box-containing protein